MKKLEQELKSVKEGAAAQVEADNVESEETPAPEAADMQVDSNNLDVHSKIKVPAEGSSKAAAQKKAVEVKAPGAAHPAASHEIETHATHNSSVYAQQGSATGTTGNSSNS
mmetsp:Transcript_34532/g.52831  ORF Transcript_34532/g.52831 Transcript_34532/m.52831 type:complete len:111 (+) Transcript_34532:395-727(+)